MRRDTIGLYIGKFQPFHNGHLYSISQILSEVDRISIVIGSSQYEGLAEMPFSAAVRRQMIERTLRREGITAFTITAVPDIHDNVRWVDHVRNFVPDFDAVYTNNELVSRLFTEKSITVRQTRLLPGISGTLVRQRLRENDASWTNMVSLDTAAIIRKTGH